MKIFLTGATGYIGHRLALNFAEEGNTVHALVRDLKSKKIPVHKNMKIFEGSLGNRSSIDHAMKNCDYTVHTAAFTDLRHRNIEPFYQTNVVGTQNICKACIENEIKHLVFTSTLSVFGPALYQVPINEEQPRIESYSNDYELTKTRSEEYILDFGQKGLPFTILNLSRVYGPGLATFSNGVNSLVSKFINDKLFFVPSNLNVEANYVYIDDVLNAHKLALLGGPRNDRFIIGGENSDYSNLFRTIKAISKSDITIIKMNYELVRQMFGLFSGLGRLIGLKKSIHPGILDSLFTNRSASSEKAKRILGYEYTPLHEGLYKTVKFLKNEN